MIQLYPKGQATFTANGIELHPSEAEVTWQIAGRYDCSLTIPREACEGITFDYGQILKVSVPAEHVNAISLGAVSYYETNTGTKLYKVAPHQVKVSYDPWEALRSYMQGDKVTYDKKNWQCNTGHGGLSTPPPNGGLWSEISLTKTVSKDLTTLESGTSIMKVRDFNDTYMEAATLNGLQGYIKIEDCTATGSSGTRTIPAFDITEQLFTINHIDKETDEHNIRLEGEHISYQLGRTMLEDCSVVGVNPATALLFIAGAMQEEYSGNLYTNIDEGEIDADWSWNNAQAAIMDPQGGLLKATGGRAIRDNRDIYIIPNPEGTAVYEVRYGVNMQTVRWSGDVSGIVTRVYPIAQREDGSRMTLPEKYIDSVLPVPYIRPEVLDTGMKIGQKVENSDGTETELTEDDVLDRMEEMAQNRFDIDHCDRAEVTLDLDWVHMPDTEEYKQYLTLRNAAPAEWVRVVSGSMDLDSVIQMTGYTYDPVLKKYKKATFGDKQQKPSVAGYDLKAGAVTNRALGSNAVRGENIAAGAITAREIEAGSIMAEQIASKVITAQLIAANAVTAEQISANDLTAIQAKLQIASIADAEIGSADIGYAQIKDASVQSLIAKDALTDRYYIDKLQVRNVQAVAATVGELVVKAADNKYYRLDVETDGSLTATEVTLTAGEIAAGVTSDGHGTIIETDLTVQDLAASNIKGINALIDKINAARINVDELVARTAFISKLNTTDIESTANLQIKTGGTFTVQSGKFSIDASGNVSLTGTINAGAGGKIAGWDINAASLTGNKTGIAKTTNDTDIAFWAGNETAGSANFRVTQGGKVTLKDLVVLNEQGTETAIDLRSYPLWKLNYATVKSIEVDSQTGAVTITTTAGSYSFNRGSGGSVSLSGAWTDNWTKFTVTASDGGTVIGTESSGAINFAETAADVKSALESDSNHTTTVTIEDPLYGVDIRTMTINASGVYSQGQTAGANSVTVSAAGWQNGKNRVSASNGQYVDVSLPSFTSSQDNSFSNHKKNVYFYTASVQGPLVTAEVDATSQYNSGRSSVTVSAAGWQNGTNRVSASNGQYVDVSLPSFTTSQDNSFSNHKKNVYFYTASVTGALKTAQVDATSEYKAGQTAGAAGVTVSSITRNADDQHNSNRTITVYAKATASNGATKTQNLTVDATTEYNAGWTGCYYTVGLNSTAAKTLDYGESITVYAQAKSSSSASGKTNVASRTITGPAAVTVTSITRNADDSRNASNHTYTVYAKATASNGATKSQNLTVNATAEYNAGWNAALAACGISGGGTVYTGGTYYARLYTVGTHGEPIYQGPGRLWLDSHDVAAK